MFSPCSLSSPVFLSYWKFISQYNVARHLLLLLFFFFLVLQTNPFISLLPVLLARLSVYESLALFSPLYSSGESNMHPENTKM